MRKLAALWIAGTVLMLLPATAGARVYTGLTTTDESNTNPGACSLREAVQAASTNVGYGGCLAGDMTTDEIVLESASDYQLTQPATNEDANLNGDIDVGVGGGGGPLIIRSDNPAVRRSITMLDQGAGVLDRVFDLMSGTVDLTLRDVDISTDEEIPNENGGVINAALAGNDLKLQNVVINAGSGVNAISGGAISSLGAGSSVSITDSEITDANAQFSGGAVFMDTAAGPLDVTRSRIAFNLASTAEFANTAGAGIYSTNAVLTITDSEVTNNTASAFGDARGGGVFSNANATIRRSLIGFNKVDSTTVATEEEYGGGVFVGGNATLDIINSTIHGNTAGANSTDDARGGGLYNQSVGDVNLDHVTFSANSAQPTMEPSTHGDHIETSNLAGGTFYTASIIPSDGTVNACQGIGITSGGYNALNPDPECPASGPGDTSAGSIGLGALGSNGGPTRTIPISSTGTAFDREPAASCATTSEGTDQRGLSRPQGAACDAGAFELCTTVGGSLPECPPVPGLPASATPAAPGPCDNLSGKAKKKCLCRQKKGKKRKKCLKRLKGRKP